MEDSHTLEPHLRDEPDCSFAAVYDGHGGDAIAYYAGREIPDKLMATAQWEEYKALEDKTVDAAAVKIGEALRQAFLDFDEAQRARPDIRSGEDQSGATAIACIITPTFIVVANAGDSRGILAKGGRVEPMSFDHKPTNAGETQRIEASGGTVTNRRVNGDLAVSRALGDFKHKDNTDLPAEQQAVSAEADIEWRRRDGTEEFVLLACDGVWDVMSNEEAGGFVRQDLLHFEEKYLSLACAMSDLVETCLMKGSRDNMSAVLIGFAADGNMHVGEDPREWKQILSDEYVVKDRDGKKVLDPQRKDMADHLPEEDPNKTIKIADLY